jgi:hypothetical protein
MQAVDCAGKRAERVLEELRALGGGPRTVLLIHLTRLDDSISTLLRALELEGVDVEDPSGCVETFRHLLPR